MQCGKLSNFEKNKDVSEHLCPNLDMSSIYENIGPCFNVRTAVMSFLWKLEDDRKQSFADIMKIIQRIRTKNGNNMRDKWNIVYDPSDTLFDIDISHKTDSNVLTAENIDNFGKL